MTEKEKADYDTLVRATNAAGDQIRTARTVISAELDALIESLVFRFGHREIVASLLEHKGNDQMRIHEREKKEAKK